MSTPELNLNLRIAKLLKEARPEEIVDILTGPGPSLLKRTNNNNNHNNNYRAPNIPPELLPPSAQP